jgi:hypothetical protein
MSCRHGYSSGCCGDHPVSSRSFEGSLRVLESGRYRFLVSGESCPCARILLNAYSYSRHVPDPRTLELSRTSKSGEVRPGRCDGYPGSVYRISTLYGSRAGPGQGVINPSARNSPPQSATSQRRHPSASTTNEHQQINHSPCSIALLHFHNGSHKPSDPISCLLKPRS